MDVWAQAPPSRRPTAYSIYYATRSQGTPSDCQSNTLSPTLWLQWQNSGAEDLVTQSPEPLVSWSGKGLSSSMQSGTYLGPPRSKVAGERVEQTHKAKTAIILPLFVVHNKCIKRAYCLIYPTYLRWTLIKESGSFRLFGLSRLFNLSRLFGLQVKHNVGNFKTRRSCQFSSRSFRPLIINSVVKDHYKGTAV